jgi:hypothetical protein
MTPAEELRAAAARLNDTRNCDNHTVDSDSHELLDLLRVLLRAREPLARLLAEVADSVEQDDGIIQDATSEDALTIARAINAGAAPGPVLGGTIADRLLGGEPR